MVSWSTVGANSCVAVEHLVESDDLAGVGGHAAHRRDQAGLGAALHFVVGLVVADGVDQVVPFQLIRIGLGLRDRPRPARPWSMLWPLKVRHLGRRVAGRRRSRPPPWCRGRSWRTRCGSLDRAAVEKQLGAVGERVFDRVGVEVLIDGVATVVPAAEGRRLHRPGLLSSSSTRRCCGCRNRCTRRRWPRGSRGTSASGTAAR